MYTIKVNFFWMSRYGPVQYKSVTSKIKFHHYSKKFVLFPQKLTFIK